MSTNPYYDPEEDADLLGDRHHSKGELLSRANAMHQVVEHMASEEASASSEATLISGAMSLLSHESPAHHIPAVIAALIDKSDETSDNLISLDDRWEYRQAEMQMQYCWVDLASVRQALNETYDLQERMGSSGTFVMEILHEYLSRRLEHARFRYFQTSERLGLNPDMFFAEHGVRMEGNLGAAHAKMLNLLGAQGGTKDKRKKKFPNN